MGWSFPGLGLEWSRLEWSSGATFNDLIVVLCVCIESSSRVTPVLGSSSSSSYDPQSTKGWRDLLKNAAPYGENHYYTPEYPCRYPSNTPGSPAALQTIITTTTKVTMETHHKTSYIMFIMFSNMYD